MFQINEKTSPALKVHIILNQNQKKFKFKRITEIYLSPFVLVLSLSWDMSCPGTVPGHILFTLINQNIKLMIMKMI